MVHKEMVPIIQFLCSNSSVELIWNKKLINSAIASQLPDRIKPTLTQHTSSDIMYFSYTEMYSYLTNVR